MAEQKLHAMNPDVIVSEFMKNVRIVPASECALILYIDQPLSESLAAQLKTISEYISLNANDLGIEIIVSYASLLINYNPLVTDHFAVKKLVAQAITTLLTSTQTSLTNSGVQTLEHVVELPVYYSVQTGPDLERIANHHNLNVEDVIRIHQQQTYRVFAIGFAPGFGYLGQVDEQIAMPRLATPRAIVPKGAVAIADRQTAVYPAASPGGWNIIGQCPLLMFNPDVEPSMPFKVGDSVQFKAIDQTEYIALGGEL
ncbi:5-oxoprolinase subunit PxpB [Psychrosphaera aquimarina]|uniref:5-oxoprolinase subunit PxpB n=1 Tax=Psychrosphaera aquimarina TaxID=2044854 RepID=A0ABU3R0L7_9GAMM|nr:5-oxoprolinase subunit PxpB [Psychrosphaera aquimarina]MDU0113222.1 5-oxoprolinase subunit PxpB [Psychrosphaera aquimarina]